MKKFLKFFGQSKWGHKTEDNRPKTKDTKGRRSSMESSVRSPKDSRTADGVRRTEKIKKISVNFFGQSKMMHTKRGIKHCFQHDFGEFEGLFQSNQPDYR